jgi:hydroxymethylpyrimidine pyrophosphatase-like HAD family hydrolase
VPLEGMMAEEISRPKKQSKGTSDAYLEQQESAKVEEDAVVDDNSKAAKKKMLKEEKREKRKLKKELKQAFKDQNGKLVKSATAEIGQLRAGVSVKKIY